MIRTYAGHWGLVTGASSGIGAEFARQLAARGMHLVLAARRTERLEELARQLAVEHGTRCEILATDLLVPHAGRKLLDEVTRRGIELDLVVNNAGIGLVAPLERTDPDRAADLIQVNVTSLTEITLLAARQMMTRGHGGIINLGSVVSFQPVASMGVYAASKAFVLHFGEALWAELEPHGVTVTTLCPGTTRTEFFDHSGVPGWAERRSSADVQTVVRTGLAAFDAGRPSVVCGWINYLTSLAVRLLPRSTVVRATLSVFREELHR